MQHDSTQAKEDLGHFAIRGSNSSRLNPLRWLRAHVRATMDDIGRIVSIDQIGISYTALLPNRIFGKPLRYHVIENLL